MTTPHDDEQTPSARDGVPSLWDHLTPAGGATPQGASADPWSGAAAQAPSDPFGSTWPPRQGTTWPSQQGTGAYPQPPAYGAVGSKDRQQDWRDPYGPPPPSGGRGRRIAAVLGAFALVVVVGLAALGLAAGSDEGAFDGGGSSSGASVDEPAYFSPRSAVAVGGGSALGLELGERADVSDQDSDEAAPGGEARTLGVTPSAGLRQVASGGSSRDPAPKAGRYLLVDVLFTPLGGASVPSRSDFALLLPNGGTLRESSSDAGWFDLFPRPSDPGWEVPRTATLVFDLPVGQDALLVYTAFDGAVASWKVSGKPAPAVAPESLPGYFP